MINLWLRCANDFHLAVSKYGDCIELTALISGGCDWPDIPLIQTITLVQFTAEYQMGFLKKAFKGGLIIIKHRDMNLGNTPRFFFIMWECLLESCGREFIRQCKWKKKWLVCVWTFHLLHFPCFFYLRFLYFILCPWSILKESTEVNWLAQQCHKDGDLRQCSATPTYSKGV